MTVPVMSGWIVQMYRYVPALVNVTVYDCPLLSVGDLIVAPPCDVALCCTVSSLVKVTLVPGFTVRLAGENAKFLIVTVCPLIAGVDEVGGANPVDPDELQAARVPSSTAATAKVRSRDL
jgi:hypothetical protein